MPCGKENASGNICIQVYLVYIISETRRAEAFLPNNYLHSEYLSCLSSFLFERKLMWERALLQLKDTFQSCLELFQFRITSVCFKAVHLKDTHVTNELS